MKVLLCGDVSPTADNWELFVRGDVESLFEDTLELFRQADVSIVNLECALTESETPISKIGPPLKAPPETAQTLKKVGVTHCGLSNNHIFDFGRKGVLDTIRVLEEAGIGHTGFGENDEASRKNLVVECGGKTLCVIAVCEHEYSYALEDRMGSRYFDEFETPLEIREAKAKYDRVVVMYHGGKEQCRYPSPRLRKACRAMAKSGADVILCQHSHCIGCYEEFEGCHILYGQGNFHFAKVKNKDIPGWNQSLAVFYDTEENAVTFLPVTAKADCGIRLMTGEEKEREMAEFAARSETLRDGTWKQGWHEFCESKREPYTRAIERFVTGEDKARGIQGFAHYLDCEAHTDVWRELFPTYNITDNK